MDENTLALVAAQLAAAVTTHKQSDEHNAVNTYLRILQRLRAEEAKAKHGP